jgi:hypothetical protein
MSWNQNDDTNSADRRADPRYDTRVEATIDDSRYESTIFTTSGFSRSGAFLQRSDNTGVALPPVGSIIKLILHWPLQTQMPPVRVEAKVIRQTPDGIGVRFDLKA